MGDTPHFIAEAQVEMIKKLAKSVDFEDFSVRISSALNVLGKYAAQIVSKQVSIQDLLVAKRLSKSPSGYSHDVFQAIAAKQLEKAGFEVSAGQTVRYLIVDSKSGTVKNRVSAAELLKPKTHYDAQKYLDMLISAGETLLEVFGYTKGKIRGEVVFHQKQVMLN